MIVNDKNEVKACRLLPRDIGLEALFFLPCKSIDLFSESLSHNLERNGTERNGTERIGPENRLLNTHGKK
jgi:hypothetical protein